MYKLRKVKQIGILFTLIISISSKTIADTIDHYMNIAKNIPRMEMKADSESQAWAKSARNVLLLTSESVAESLALSNETATKNGYPLFCLPPSVVLNGQMLNELIQQTYNNLSSRLSDKNRLTVSQIALIGVSQQYPCISPEKKEP